MNDPYPTFGHPPRFRGARAAKPHCILAGGATSTPGYLCASALVPRQRHCNESVIDPFPVPLSRHIARFL